MQCHVGVEHFAAGKAIFSQLSAINLHVPLLSIFPLDLFCSIKFKKMPSA